MKKDDEAQRAFKGQWAMVQGGNCELVRESCVISGVGIEIQAGRRVFHMGGYL